MIALFIKHVKFFKLHQPSLILSMARKIKLVELNEIDDKLMVIVLEGQLRYKGELFTTGQLINR
jgi:hypothetical protein